jgi:hypothetical protein
MSGTSKERQLLVDRFIASFEKLADLIAFDTDPIAQQLATGDPDQSGFRRWRPIKANTDQQAIDKICAGLAIRFPPLFELLLLSYRWAEVDLRLCTLLANPLGRDLSGFRQQISKDRALWKCLTRDGYVQFGKGPGGDYDAVCFDTRSRTKKGDRRIVKIDHEEILCNDRIKIVSELAPSFEQLMLRTIDQLNQP